MKIKGTGIVVLPEFIRQRFGQAKVTLWTNSLGPAARQIYTSPILINEWYPFREAYLEPTEALCRLFFNNDPQGAWEAGSFSADYALRGVYKAFVKLTSVKYFITRASAVLTTYYQPSAMLVKVIENNRAVLHMTQFPLPSQLAELRIAGWIHRSLEIHNCKDVGVAITSSLAKGDPYTEFILTWS
jgi:hypothetical protein